MFSHITAASSPTHAFPGFSYQYYTQYNLQETGCFLPIAERRMVHVTKTLYQVDTCTLSLSNITYFSSDAFKTVGSKRSVYIKDNRSSYHRNKWLKAHVPRLAVRNKLVPGYGNYRDVIGREVLPIYILNFLLIFYF